MNRQIDSDFIRANVTKWMVDDEVVDLPRHVTQFILRFDKLRHFPRFLRPILFRPFEFSIEL
jgi:hypothetical protein